MFNYFTGNQLTGTSLSHTKNKPRTVKRKINHAIALEPVFNTAT